MTKLLRIKIKQRRITLNFVCYNVKCLVLKLNWIRKCIPKCKQGWIYQCPSRYLNSNQFYYLIVLSFFGLNKSISLLRNKWELINYSKKIYCYYYFFLMHIIFYLRIRNSFYNEIQKLIRWIIIEKVNNIRLFFQLTYNLY